MKNFVSMAALLALLAACGDGQPFDDVTDPDTGGGTDTDGEVPVNGVPAAVAGDMKAASYNADTGTLLVQISLDGDDVLQAYTSAGAVGGYDRFTQQDDPLDRAFTAFAGESTDGSVTAVVAMDGGQFNRYFGGITFTQDGYVAPDSGLASYAGNYVGLLNFGPPVGNAPGGTPGEVIPRQSFQVTGEVFLNADFTDNLVNGAIYNRSSDFGAMLSVALIVADVGSNGAFEGIVEISDGDPLADAPGATVGTYAGTFGGTNAAGVAGGIFLDGDFLGDTFENENEYGIFVLDQCVGGGVPTVCSSVEDVDE